MQHQTLLFNLCSMILPWYGNPAYPQALPNISNNDMSVELFFFIILRSGSIQKQKQSWGTGSTQKQKQQSSLWLSAHYLTVYWQLLVTVIIRCSNFMLFLSICPVILMWAAYKSRTGQTWIDTSCMTWLVQHNF